MAKITTSVEVSAPTDIVFDLLTDFERSPEIVEKIVHVEMVSDPPHKPARVGTRLRETRVMFGKEATEEMWITEITHPGESPDGAGRWIIEARSSGMHYLTELGVTPTPNGSRMEMAFSGRGESLAAKLMSPIFGLFMKGMIARELTRDLEQVKAKAESRPAVEFESR